MASPYTIEPLGRFWSVHHERDGFIVEDAACYAEAQSWAEQHAEEGAAREAADAAAEALAEAEYDAEPVAAPVRRAA